MVQQPLRQVYPDPETLPGAASTRVDIVAVHGLNPRSRDDTEHAWNTWRNRASGRLWLRDDLPQFTPDARIFIYEYNATAVYGKDKSTFVDKSNELLEAVRAERDDEERPILFLAHSMGGLLVKQALINAGMNPKYSMIKEMTKGIAFFATPHHGGDATMVGLGSVATKIARTAGFQQGDDVLETLKSGNIFSDVMHEHWRHQMVEYNIISFWGALDTVVPGESTKLGMSGDREHVVKLNADHKGVCKFGRSQVDEDNLRLVRRNVQDIYDAALQEGIGSHTSCQAAAWHGVTTPTNMNSLNLSMSIKGLRTATENLCSLIQTFSTSWHSSNRLRDCRQEISLVGIGLRSFERYLQRLDTVDPQRKKLIQVDDLIITFSDAIMIFSEFEELLRRLERMRNAGVGIPWGHYTKTFQQHLERIQRLKESLQLMLTIVECDTNIEAYENRERLQALVEAVINENQSLKSKLSLLEDRFDARSTFTRDPIDHETDDVDTGSETATIREGNTADSFRDSNSPLSISNRISFAFEKILQQSWVYKRNEKNECDQSFITTTTDARSRTWSIFSGISMAHISILSVIAMPITLLDISYGHYYEINSRPMDSAPVAGGEGDMFDHRQVLPSLPEHPETQVSSQLGKSIIDEYQIEYEGSDWDLDDEVFPCKGCGELLEEGKAFELAGNRWHLDCFRCGTCHTLLDSDSKLLLLRDGSLICNNCTYDCSACGEKIEDLAILTGDKAFCATCFLCRNCKQQIKNLRYARTSQGFFCMECHEALMARRRRKALIAKSESGTVDGGKVLPTLPEDLPIEWRYSDSTKEEEEEEQSEPQPPSYENFI
ncbi:unnamed protein product [Clonostachys rosea]|uniref:LIM zinc-binding domain-containing protein n=1 Tax=Bionectria ochroleuca TaxID=29856 RepID=A0ABY6U3S1_BIOOC|nr:unnamed protein product [Clonostachys rosea]